MKSVLKDIVVLLFLGCVCFGALHLGVKCSNVDRYLLTQKIIQEVKGDIREFVLRTGRIPSVLSEVAAAVGADEDGYACDAWGNPLHYAVSNRTVSVWSNGKPLNEIRCYIGSSFEVP